MALVAVTGPAAEPVSLAEARLSLRVDSTDEDAEITAIIRAAREIAEQRTNRALVTRVRDFIFDRFPTSSATPIEIPNPPLRAVASITYVDADGVTQTWAAAEYDIDLASRPGRVLPAWGEVYPTTRAEANAVTVRHTVGGATPFTANATTDTLTALGHPYANGDVARVRNSGGALPAGLAADTDYYVIGATATTVKLSATSGGAAIDITDAGAGTHYLGEIPDAIRAALKTVIGHLYRNREAVVTGTIATRVPLTAEDLFASEKVARIKPWW